MIKDEKAWVEEQINKLLPFSVQTSQGNTLKITCDLWLTVIDGKVLSVITDSISYANCPLCGAKPSEMNKLSLVQDRSVSEEKLRYGLSPLHAWIRVLEFLLRLSYKNHPNVQKWRVSDPDQKKIVEKTKQTIQKCLLEELNLRVDFVRPGGAGTSNDGNTARKALSDVHRKKFAEILGLEEWLLNDLHTVLVAISSGLPLSASKFGTFCQEIAQRYVKVYPWYFMPSATHKLLVHGEAIIRTSLLPVGMLSEQAGESCNKLYKRFRENHSRKNSRVNTLTDVFNRCLESSDQVISFNTLADRRCKMVKIPINSEVAALLQAYEVETSDDSQNDDHISIIDQDCSELVLDCEIEDLLFTKSVMYLS